MWCGTGCSRRAARLPTLSAATPPQSISTRGKKEKISRGDIAGYLIHRGGLRPDEVGRITLDDHSALVAVPRAALGPFASGATDEIPAEAAALPLLERLAPHRLKNTRVRLSLIK